MITLSPAKVKLLHFPRSHLPHVTHAIIKACFFRDSNDADYFFSFTENAYEISIVANQQVIDRDFVPALTAAQCPDMGISSDIFRILQVDDEGGQDLSGKRISDLSGTLAQGQFSIFYMSTYQTDFVLVKDRRLRQAVQALQEHGFEFEDLEEVSLEQAMPELSLDADAGLPLAPPLPDKQAENTFFESNVLENELRCVGLNPHYRREWAMTMLKIICYPELIIEGYSTDDNTRFFSYTASSDGISLVADQRTLDLFEEEYIFQDEDSASLRVIQVNLANSHLDRCGIVRSISHPLASEAHINLLYLSTFKSANILVSADDLQQAEEILSLDLKNGMLMEVVLEPSL